jgi:ankyrin repeat protein
MGDTEVSEGTAGEYSVLIDRAHPAVLEMRELHSTTNADSPDDNDSDVKFNTTLHRAVLLVCGNVSNRDGYYRKLDKLMTSHIMKLNMPNKEGYTAMGYAVERRKKKCVKHMLQHPSAKHLHLDYYPGDRECTVREIMIETYPKLQPLLPAPLMQSLDSPESDKQLLAALQRDKFKAFSKRLNTTNANLWYDEPYHSYLLEIACQMKKRSRFIKLLLDSGADPNNKNRVTGMPLLHATARSGNFVHLEVLLKKEEINVSLKDNKDRTILHWLAKVRERKPGDKYILENCFKLLLHKLSITKIVIDYRDVSGNTALYVALQSGFRDRAKLLLSGGADVSVLGNASQVLLPTTLPVLEEILDDCLLSNDKLLMSKNFVLKLNKELLTNIVPPIAESQHLRELLKHPVISTFLFLKWLNVRFIFFLDVAFYFTFLFFLTAYILLSDPYNTVNDRRAASNTTGNFSYNDNNITSDMSDSNVISQPNDSSLFLLWIISMILLTFLTLRELLQMILHRLDYVQSLENWLEISLIIATFVSCSGVVDGMKIKAHFSAVALLLGWSELLLMLGRLPQLSVQLEMLRRVSRTFYWYMKGYVTLLIAFAFSFYMLFKGSSEERNAEMFANPFVSFLKTIVMFTGEFEASSLSFDTFSFTSHVIFLIFVVLVAIVVLNSLNGLAVSDTGEIRKDAETLSLAARAKLISRIETFVKPLPKFMKPDTELKEEMFVIHPKVRNGIESAAIRSLLRIISEKTKPREEDKSTAFQTEWCMFTEKFSALELRLENLEKNLDFKWNELRQILMQIQTHLGIGNVGEKGAPLNEM